MILTFLDDLTDFRRRQGLQYELKHVILFSIMAILSNAKSYRDIARFIETHYERLNDEFNLNWKKSPGYTTIRNLIIGLGNNDIEKSFRSYSKSLSNLKEHEETVSISVDGKVLRGSYDNFNDKRAIQILSFFESETNLILAHKKIKEKTNEIPVFQELIKDLELGDVVYTLDALHCQKKLLKSLKRKKRK